MVLIVLQTTMGSSLPRGFTTFFSTPACPSGWRELNEARGRLIVSVADPTTAGITVNAPLQDQEDIQHSHSYSTTVHIPHKSVAAAVCCNQQGAEHGDYDVSGTSLTASSGYPFTQLILCSFDGDTHTESSGESVAFGSMAYFNPDVTACPSGWTAVKDSAGRFLIPGYEDGGVVRNDAAPLSSGEDRQHNHTFSLSVPLTPLSFEGAGGCCDTNNAMDVPAQVEGESQSASSNIPYVQLLTCVSEEPTFNMSSMPQGALVYNAIACPPDWAPLYEVAGRFLVALPAGGLPGASFGGASISPPSSSGKGAPEVAHDHTLNNTLTLNPSQTMLVSGCCDGGYVQAGSYPFSGPSDESVIGLPYSMVPLCQYVGSGKK